MPLLVAEVALNICYHNEFEYIFSFYTIYNNRPVVIMFLLTTYDILIVCATVVVSFALPRLPAPFATHALSRLLVCVLVVVLCVCLPRQLGVPLALLLVLSTVPTVRLELLVGL